MKKSFTQHIYNYSLLFLACIAFAPFAKAQTFTGTGGGVGGSTTSCFQMTVASANSPMNSSNGISQACFTLNHPNIADLDIWLISPAGSQILLTCCGNGTGSVNGTFCFNQGASNYVLGPASPGSFLPIYELGNINDGQTSTGIWELCIVNNGFSAGTLSNWNINLSNSPAPMVTYIGNNSCLTQDCGPIGFYDSGGPIFSYGNNENETKTFCPPVDGQCIRVTFNSWSIENNWDFLDVYNGESINAPSLGFLTGTGTGPLNVTSTQGCLTFNFNSDFITTASGWDATITCVPCAAAIASSRPANDDCANAIPLVGSGDNSNATGCDVDGPDPWGAACGWLSTENSMFYSFTVTPSTPQPLQITLLNVACSGGANQLQMAIFNSNCDSIGLYGSNFHGCTAGIGSITLSATPNPLPAGNYILAVDGNAGSTCTWDVSSPVLAVSDLDFSARYLESSQSVELNWSVSLETELEGYIIQRSEDQQSWTNLDFVSPDKERKETQNYVFHDILTFGLERAYYRLLIKDLDGKTTYSKDQEIYFGLPQKTELVRGYPNPVTQSYALDICLHQDAQVTATIINIKGSELEIIDFGSKVAGYHQIKMQAGHLPPGLYLCRLKLGNQEIVTKFLRKN